MIEYKIKYNYNTGDSFNTERNCIAYLECTWTNLEIVKDNLRRIREHYLYNDSLSQKNKRQIKKIKKEAEVKDWFVAKYDSCLKLLANSRTEFQISAPWVGYFKSLNEVEIESNDSEMKVSFK